MTAGCHVLTHTARWSLFPPLPPHEGPKTKPPRLLRASSACFEPGPAHLRNKRERKARREGKGTFRRIHPGSGHTDHGQMTRCTAASLVVCALLGSPRGEAFTPSFAVREVSMVSAVFPPHGSSAATNVPTSGGMRKRRATGARAVEFTRGTVNSNVNATQKQPATSTMAPPSHSSEENEADNNAAAHHHQRHRQHPASASRFADDDIFSPQPAAQLSSQPDLFSSPALSEPRGGEVDRRGEHEQLMSKRDGAFLSSHDRPWRQRARDARRRTAAERDEGFETEGEGEVEGELESGGTANVYVKMMRKRASEKEEVVATRKVSKQKAVNRMALPIVDLVGIVSPLVIIAGMSIVQHIP